MLGRAGNGTRDAIVDPFMMDVYLVPVGPTRYELYCEVPDDPEEAETEPPRGFIRRLRSRFRGMLAEAERERRQARAAHPQRTWVGRIKARIMRWVAESIAEQRLLWHLRRQTKAALHHPDDLDNAQAMAILRTRLREDFEKHRLWLIVDTLLFIASGVFFFVPGPNILAYYFAFRLVGHYLSMRGARLGLSGIQWQTEQSPPLAELRKAMHLAPELRERHVHDVALRLHLEHLATFFERSAVTGVRS